MEYSASPDEIELSGIAGIKSSDPIPFNLEHNPPLYIGAVRVDTMDRTNYILALFGKDRAGRPIPVGHVDFQVDPQNPGKATLFQSLLSEIGARKESALLPEYARATYKVFNKPGVSPEAAINIALKYRRGGVGTALLKFGEEFMKTQGVEEIEVTGDVTPRLFGGKSFYPIKNQP